MKTILSLMILGTVAPLSAPGLAAAPEPLPQPQPQPQRRPDQMQAFDARRSGKMVSVREIERRVVPTMADAQYLGFEFDAGSSVYTLKFLRDGRVIWIDVDGRSGQVIGRTGR